LRRHLFTSDSIYGNCSVLSPEGVLMFRCDNKKLNWYLKRDLATIVGDNTIKLNFVPNGLGNSGRSYGSQVMENKCVNCGCTKDLTRHHVVPFCYRKFFPLEIKSHNFHDVLPMCVECHSKYERIADDLKMELAEIYQAPINGINIKAVDYKYVKIAKTLLSESNIPKSRVLYLRNKIKDKFGIKRLTKNKIIEISKTTYNICLMTHGEIVVKKIDNTQSFIETWRKHFVKNNSCQFLPENWNIKYEF